MTEKCSNCDAWIANGETVQIDDRTVRKGACRASHPEVFKMDNGFTSVFPPMLEDGWCREFQAIDEGFHSRTRGN